MARYRLVIEQGSHMGVFIYKVLDRETGEVVQQLPREEVARMGNQKGYAAGTVISTTV
ncbi:flagellar protein FlaG [Brevundimonas poindexterae]|uniref:flagellar protein FlaG n=1 Tax=Brevundimonas poindexterae TaxID=74325 RepID=UPI001CFC498D|nr:flagellar protein FlaG [Brevundimonas poindexterae]